MLDLIILKHLFIELREWLFLCLQEHIPLALISYPIFPHGQTLERRLSNMEVGADWVTHHFTGLPSPDVIILWTIFLSYICWGRWEWFALLLFSKSGIYKTAYDTMVPESRLDALPQNGEMGNKWC